MPTNEVCNNGVLYAIDDKGKYRPFANFSHAEVCTDAKEEDNRLVIFKHVVSRSSYVGEFNVPRKSIARLIAFIHYGASPEIERKFPKKKKRGTARRIRKWL